MTFVVDPAVPPAREGTPPVSILIDYDGTISLTDVTEILLAEHVAGAVWEDAEVDSDAGRMGSRRLMAWEVSLIEAEPATLRATAAAQPHDPGFVPFVERARSASIPIEIVSDGYGFFIQPALEALGVGDLPIVTARTFISSSTFSMMVLAVGLPSSETVRLLQMTSVISFLESRPMKEL